MQEVKQTEIKEKPRMKANVFNKGRAVVYLQDNQFIGFVEPQGASEIKGSARDAGLIVEDYGSWFNVVYRPIKKISSKELMSYEK
jgi:hypothetical protein